MTNAQQLFAHEVDRFQAWADAYPIKIESRYGEWECDYDDWNAIYVTLNTVLHTMPISSWDSLLMAQILYILGRDNEMEIVADAIAADPERLLVVAAAAIGAGDRDAQWQCAEHLGALVQDRSRAEDLLVCFLSSGDEYVRRRALMALGRLQSPLTDVFVQQAWESGNEYQRMVALSALKDAGSVNLEQYLLAGETDPSAFVRAHVERVRAGSDP